MKKCKRCKGLGRVHSITEKPCNNPQELTSICGRCGGSGEESELTMAKKTIAKFEYEMQKCIDNPSTESAHSAADGLLAEFIQTHCPKGKKLVELYYKVDKWFA